MWIFYIVLPVCCVCFFLVFGIHSPLLVEPFCVFFVVCKQPESSRAATAAATVRSTRKVLHIKSYTFSSLLSAAGWLSLLLLLLWLCVFVYFRWYLFVVFSLFKYIHFDVCVCVCCAFFPQPFESAVVAVCWLDFFFLSLSLYLSRDSFVCEFVFICASICNMFSFFCRMPGLCMYGFVCLCAAASASVCVFLAAV